MGKFEKEAREMLEAIGGKDNIAAVTHCATRMRFVLNDDSKADVKRLEAIPAVKGTFTNAGQFQAIIGNDVPIFYNDFIAISGIEGVSKEAAKSATQSKLASVCLGHDGRDFHANYSSDYRWWFDFRFSKYPRRGAVVSPKWQNHC